ncbi:MAG: hypothetical protein QM831_03985 [Kofleriaceae bacterium]
MSDDPSRLARRVRWLERYRHWITIVVAAAAVVFLCIELPEVLGVEWPLFHARLMAIVAGLVLAFGIEIGLAGLLAWWELKHDRSTKSELPKAVVTSSSASKPSRS